MTSKNLAFYPFVGLLTGLLLMGCSTPVNRIETREGQVIHWPVVKPGSLAELREQCDLSARFLAPPQGANIELNARICVDSGRGQVEERRKACSQDAGVKAARAANEREVQLTACAHGRAQYAEDSLRQADFFAFKKAQTPRDWSNFVKSVSTVDRLGLAKEARQRLASSCVPWALETAPPAAIRDWLAIYSPLSDTDCAGFVNLARSKLQRIDFLALGESIDAMSKFVQSYAGNDSLGLVPDVKVRLEKQRLLKIELAEIETKRLQRAADTAAVAAAKTPQQMQALMIELGNRDAELSNLLNQRLKEFSANESAYILSASIEELKSFLQTRFTYATVASAAVTEGGLVNAEKLLRMKLSELALSGEGIQLEPLLTDSFVDESTRKGVEEKLRRRYIERKDFTGMHRMFVQTRDSSYLKSAKGWQLSSEEGALLEEDAMSTLIAPSRLFSVKGRFSETSARSKTQENMGWFANFTSRVYLPLSGVLDVGLRPNPPLFLKYHAYRIDYLVELEFDRAEQLRSGVLGNTDKNVKLTRAIRGSVTVTPPQYQGTSTFDFGEVEAGYFQSGSAGGFTAILPLADPLIRVRLLTVTKAN
jgi:hypothetical protein